MAAPGHVAEVVASPGRPLDGGTRAFMESRFGHDFASVRVHADSAASSSASRMDAAAYTFGRHIAFRSPLYSPGSVAGRRLIAHELAHVVQQRGGGTSAPSDASGSHEERAEKASAAVAAGGRAPDDLGATAVGVARQPMHPAHARGHAGEQGMGFELYRAEDGWIFIEGPSGAGGHGITRRGFDGVAYHAGRDELHLVDNKSLRSSGPVRSATAIDPEANLPQNVEELSVQVESMQHLPPRVRARVQDLLWQARQALANRLPLPAKVQLIVTGVGGRSQAVSPRLHQSGLRFRSEPTPPGPRPAAVEPPAATRPPATAPSRRGSSGGSGVTGGLLGIGIPLVLGLIHEHAVERRVREQAQTEGYVSPGSPSGQGLLYDIGAWLLDPLNEADRAVGIDARLNLPAWRARVREAAGRKRPGETLSITWDLGRCTTDLFGRQEIEQRELTYRKQPDGRWTVVSGSTAGTPDINEVISTDMPDETIRRILTADRCSSWA